MRHQPSERPSRALRGLLVAFLVAVVASAGWGQASAGLVQAEQLIRQGRFGEADAFLARVLATTPSARGHYLHGFALLELYRFEQAAEAFARALDFEPDRPEWRHALAKALLEQGKNRAAIDELDRALALDARPAYRFAKAMCALNIGDLSLAERELTSSLAAEPGNAAAHLALGRIRFDRGDWQAAAEALSAALELDPGLVEARYLNGLAADRLGRRELARQELERVVRAVPGHVGALYNLGRVLQRLGEPQAARARLEEFGEKSELADRADFLTRAVKRNPDNLPGRLELARTLLDLGRTQEALDELLGARSLAPRHAPTYELMAAALRRLGRAEEAARAERFAAQQGGER